MSLASQGTEILPLDDCFIQIGGDIQNRIFMYTLPDISDSHDATYGEETGIGRSMPIKTFGSGGNRSISWTATFIANDETMLRRNLYNLRLLQAATYPRDNAGGIQWPYAPPPICYLRCGDLLSNESDSNGNPLLNDNFRGEPFNQSTLCTVLKSCSVKFPKDVPWSDFGYIPYKFEVSLTFDVVYNTEDLPGAERILRYGR